VAGHTGDPDDYAYNFNGSTGLNLPSDTLSSYPSTDPNVINPDPNLIAISIAFWAKGNEEQMPDLGQAFFAVDPNETEPPYTKARVQILLHGNYDEYADRWTTIFIAGEGFGDQQSFLLNPGISEGGSWHHFVFTKNVEKGSLDIWVDGQLKARQVSMWTPLSLADATVIQIGSSYLGAIDEFMIFDTELTRDEIRTLADYQTPDLVKPHLYGWWKFDEGAGVIGTDSSGAGNDGVFAEGQENWVTGVDGLAYNFDNLDYMGVPLSAVDQISDEVTVAYWAKVNYPGYPAPWGAGELPFGGIFEAVGYLPGEPNPNLWETQCSHLAGYYPNWSGYTPPDANQLRWCLTFPAGYGWDDQTYYAFPNDSDLIDWHHFVCTKDRNQGVIRIFLDGNLVQSRTDDRTLSINSDDYRFFTIGSTTQGGSPFPGSIDDFQIYDIAHLDEMSVGRILGTTDVNIAFGPNPYDGATGVSLATSVLSWHPGDNAQSHRVYFGTNPTVVATSNSGYTELTDPSFTVPEPLQFGATYYWRVDEVNGLQITRGSVWSFTVEGSYLVDGMETYGLLSPKITNYWIKSTGTGSVSLQTGTSDPTKVFAGAQSMKLTFNNNASPYKAEFTADVLTLPYASRDFAPEGVKAMDLRIRGDITNVVNTVYVTLTDNETIPNSGTVQCPDPNVLIEDSWYPFRINLSDPAFSAINKSNLKSITIGIGDGAGAGQSGDDYCYIDQIELYASRCLGAYDSDADITGYNGEPDCQVDLLDWQVFADQWQSSGPDADFDGNGIVNIVDLSVLANDWLQVWIWP
jgi:hypothetical protein